jgi:hypothetical protein
MLGDGYCKIEHGQFLRRRSCRLGMIDSELM